MPADIVIINDYAYIDGGASQVALTSAMGLARRGHNVILFAAAGPAMPELARAGVEVVLTGQHDILSDPNRARATTQGIWNRKSAKMFSDRLDRLDRTRTIIHVHAWTKALSSSVVRLAISKGFKVVFTLHDYFIACPNGGFFNYPSNRICLLKGLSAACISSNCDSRSYAQKLWRVARQIVQKRIGMIPDGVAHFIFVSRFSYNILKDYIKPGAGLYHVANPIDTIKSAPVDVAANSAFSVIGRISKEKGSLFFAGATLDAGFDAVFIGDGPVREFVSRINPKARITGWVQRNELAWYLDKTRVLVFPSLLYETQGLVVQEAASRGIPAVIPETSAATEVVEDNVTGLKFRGADASDMIEKMRVLLDNDRVKAMGRAAYERYWQSPATMDGHVAALEAVYDFMLTGSSSKASSLKRMDG